MLPIFKQFYKEWVLCLKVSQCSYRCSWYLNILPHPADIYGLVIVKLKQKLQYRGHIYLEPILPSFIFSLLKFLRTNKPLYYDIEINL